MWECARQCDSLVSLSFCLDMVHYLSMPNLVGLSHSTVAFAPSRVHSCVRHKSHVFAPIPFSLPRTLTLTLFFGQVRLQRQAKREDMLMRRLASAAAHELGWIAQQTCALAAQSQAHLLSPFLDDNGPSSALDEGARQASGLSRHYPDGENDEDEDLGFSSRLRESKPKKQSSNMHQSSISSSNLGSALNRAKEHTQEVRRLVIGVLTAALSLFSFEVQVSLVLLSGPLSVPLVCPFSCKKKSSTVSWINAHLRYSWPL